MALRPEARHSNLRDSAVPNIEPDALEEEAPLAQLRSPWGGRLRVGILSDFIRVSYANGAVFQTRFLYRRLLEAGQEPTVIAAGDPAAAPDEIAPGSVALPSLPLLTYPGLRLPMPPRPSRLERRLEFDLTFAQTTSPLLLLGVWMREMHGTPLLCVNTTHLPGTYDVLLPSVLARQKLAHTIIQALLRRPFERFFADIYNASDGLVVLSEGMREYWRSNGVTVPIHVIPRAIPSEFDEATRGPDPYPALLGPELGGERGTRLLCVGRHLREKSQDRVIRVFARHILPGAPRATLTMVGQGPHTEDLKRIARELGVEKRVFFAGEISWTELPAWYAHADLFLHASLTETFGNVLTEALWCGLPVLAFADGMGASAQVVPGVNGNLVPPGSTEAEKAAADAELGRSARELLADPRARQKLGKGAETLGRKRNSHGTIEQLLANAFASARRHHEQSGAKPLAQGSRLERVLVTARRFVPWAVTHVLLSATGYLNPGRLPGNGSVHQPRIWR